MTTTPLNFYARVWDIDASAPLQITVQRADPTTHAFSSVTVTAEATNSMITQWAIGKTRNSAGTVKLGVAYGNAFANAIIQAFGGPTYRGPVKKYLIELFRDGGTTPCTCCWLESCTLTVGSPGKGILIDAEDVFSGMTRAYLDHLTFNGAPFQSVLSGAPGTIPVQANGSPTGTTIKGTKYPAAFDGVRGLDLSIPLAPSDRSPENVAKLGWTFAATAPGNFALTAINADIWDDTVANGLLTVLRAATGKFDPKDPAPIGSRAAYHVDIASRLVNCGYVGDTPIMSLVDHLAAGTYELGIQQALFDASALVLNPGNQNMKAGAEWTGGNSNHGLPDGATITGLETIFDTGVAANAAYLYLMVLACKTGSDGGGVYFNIHDGVLRPLSQAFDVNCMAQDGTSKALVVGTPHGVFSRVPKPNDLTTLPTWAQVGKLSANILQLCIPAANIIWALADEGNGSVSIFQYPAPVGDSDTTDLGYGGWSKIKQGTNITAMAGGIGNLYYVEASDPTTLLLQQHGLKAQEIPTPKGEGITGIDYLPIYTGVVVRTTGGSAGLYSVVLGTTSMTNLNPGGANPKAGGLADAFGYLIVNRVVQCGAPTLNGSTAVLLACTDQGVYFSNQAPGTAGFKWLPATVQSGLTDRNVILAAASPQITVLGHSFERGYASSGSTVGVSNSGFIWSFDLLQAALDKGPFWTSIGQKCGGGLPFPTNEVGAIASVGVDPDLGIQNGAINGNVLLHLPANSPFNLKKNFVRRRALTSRNDFTYSTIQIDSAAPYNQKDVQSRAEVSADDSRGAIDAAEELDLGEWRYLSQNSENPLTFTASGMTARVQEDYLLKLITGDLIQVSADQRQIGTDGTLTVIVDWQNQGFYVLEYHERKVGSELKVDLTLGNIMAMVTDALTQIQAILAGTAYDVGRGLRYRRAR